MVITPTKGALAGTRAFKSKIHGNNHIKVTQNRSWPLRNEILQGFLLKRNLKGTLKGALKGNPYRKRREQSHGILEPGESPPAASLEHQRAFARLWGIRGLGIWGVRGFRDLGLRGVLGFGLRDLGV